MQANIINTVAHERFNNLPVGDTLEKYEWFTIAPVRHDESEQATVQCEAGWAEFWTNSSTSNTSARRCGESERIEIGFFMPLDTIGVDQLQHPHLPGLVILVDIGGRGAIQLALAINAGAQFGLDRFGESAPAGELFEHYGFTAENVVAVAKGLLD